jgi:FKBP-type peptidyl-prolyl cis-trans isomerase (trigger factor)
MTKQAKTKVPASNTSDIAHDHDHAGHDHAPTTPKNSIIADNIKFHLSVPWANVEKAREHALEHLTEHAQLDGFRLGKAPKKLVAERLGKTKLLEAAIEEMLPQVYTAEVLKRGIKPVINPQITPISLEEGKTWEFEVQTAEAPKIELGDYQDVVRGAKAAASILIPGKDVEKTEKETDEDKLRKIFGALLEKYQVRIPELLIREEVNRSLSRFLQQLERMHIPLDEYLKSVNKTADQLREEYAMSALTSLQLEFLLAEIAKAAKITASDKEVDDVIASLPNEDIKRANSTPQQRLNIGAGLVKQKTIAHLLSL